MISTSYKRNPRSNNSARVSFYIQIIFLAWFVIIMQENALAADEAPTPTIRNPGTQLLDSQKKFRRLKQGIEDHKFRIRESRNKEKSLLSELESIDQNLRKGKQKLTELKSDLQQQGKLIEQKQQELESITLEKERSSSHVEKRLAAYYRMGKIGVMNVFFSASTLPDLLNFNEQFQHLLQYDRHVFAGYRIMIAELSQSHDALLREKEQLETIIRRVEDQEEQLADSRLDRMDLLTRVNTEKKLYQRALEELEEATKQLTAKLQKLKKSSPSPVSNRQVKTSGKESAKKKRPSTWLSFDSLKGRLDPPVPGTVVTYFGKNTKGKFGITTYENGINIKTKAGTEIKAIYNGKVAYAGTLRGYGKIIIIDHGGQYYSLMSNAENFLPQEGDTLQKGEVIGIMRDNNEGLLTEGLHFEIRHGTEPENPLHWINNAKLKILATKKPK